MTNKIASETAAKWLESANSIRKDSGSLYKNFHNILSLNDRCGCASAQEYSQFVCKS